MPDIRLTRDEQDGDLPPACMCCGAPATVWVERSFLMHDPIVRGSSGFREVFAIRYLLAAANTPRFRVRTSFCPQHRNYWRLRAVLLFGGLAGLFAVLFLGLVVTVLLLTVAKVDAPWVSACAIVPFLLYFIPWIILLKVTQTRTIRVRLIEDGAVVLQNVSEGYIAALQARRHQTPPQVLPARRPLQGPPAPAEQIAHGPVIPSIVPTVIPAGPTGKRIPREPDSPRQETLLPWVIAGSIGLLLLLSGLVVLVVVLSPSEPGHHEVAQAPRPAAKAVVDPNAPDPKEGPPPRGWTVLFRSEDAAVWNTDSPTPKFAIPVRRAHSKIRHLRLKRMDTGEFLILPITHKQLAREDRPNPAKGCWWNGTAALEWNARHLGIVQVPPAPTRERGVVGIAGDGFNALTGSGFGGRCLIDDGTWCCWRGQAIPRTAFEIAVTADPLTNAEKRMLLP